jgi:flagellar hook-basal body complex protein FliE
MSLLANIQQLQGSGVSAMNPQQLSSGVNLQDIKDLNSAKGAFDKINANLKSAGVNFQNIPGFQSALEGIQKSGKAEGSVGMSQSLEGTSGGKSHFGEIFENAVRYVDDKQKTAATEAKAIFTGESDNLHQAVLAMREGRLAFNLLVEMRNQLMEGMQELARIQVA